MKTKKDLYILALLKGVHRYVFVYHDDRLIHLMRQVNRLADDPELNFSWSDAARIIERAKQRVNGGA